MQRCLARSTKTVDNPVIKYLPKGEWSLGGIFLPNAFFSFSEPEENCLTVRGHKITVVKDGTFLGGRVVKTVVQ